MYRASYKHSKVHNLFGYSILFRCSHLYFAAECSGNELRLTGGTSSSNGRVEVCYNGVWSTLCVDNWNIIAVQVVCRQLGYKVNGRLQSFCTIITICQSVINGRSTEAT